MTTYLFLLLSLFATIATPSPVKLAQRDGATTPFSLTNTDLYDDIVQISDYAAASYCISSFNGVKVGQLNEACTDVSCTEAEEDVYVVDIVNSVSHALILAQNSTKQIIIAFQGSSSLLDWILDFSFIPVPFESYGASNGLNVNSVTADDPKVHVGFQTAAQNFFDYSISVLQYLHEKYPDYEVIVTGHSLGGALASLAGVELYLMGYNPAIVSLAGPKVFSPSLAAWVDEVFNTNDYISKLQSQSISAVEPNTYTRITHRGDIVPCVPLVEMGYEHAGSEFYISKADLPQTIDTITIRGLFQEKYEIEILGGILVRALTDLGGLLKEFIVVGPHLYYFVVMSQCNGLAGLFGLDGN
ncbi:unnamed protein product [Ambrosiozyma monospora]|uniref:Unnamed protein product n=1 Tax=Ambrosiozyma monospora TaxID=43982 RepID=A0ACB5T195_AMBMO|nr:unnamed protein product [Ambrosiozyma monospora]